MNTLQKKYNFLLTDPQNNLKTTNNQNNDQNTKLNDLKSDYLSLIRCTYPYCNCGKCIFKNTKEKEKQRTNNNLPYGNISTTYNNQYNYINNPNNNNNKNQNLNSNNNTIKDSKDQKLIVSQNKSRLDNCFKEHLKSGFTSIMKSDYIAIQTEPNTQMILQKDNIEISSKSPFIGRSNYAMMFPGWEISAAASGRSDFSSPQKKSEIAFTAKSNYQQNFERFEDRYYNEKRASPILKKDNLEVNGPMLTETTSQKAFQAYDFFVAKSFNEKSTRKKNDSDNFKSLPGNRCYSKDAFLSSYERAFMLNNLKGSLNKLNGLIGNAGEFNRISGKKDNNNCVNLFEVKEKNENANEINFINGKNKNEYDKAVDAIISGSKKVSIKHLEEFNMHNEKSFLKSNNASFNEKIENKGLVKN